MAIFPIVKLAVYFIWLKLPKHFIKFMLNFIALCGCENLILFSGVHKIENKFSLLWISIFKNIIKVQLPTILFCDVTVDEAHYTHAHAIQ